MATATARVLRRHRLNVLGAIIEILLSSLRPTERMAEKTGTQTVMSANVMPIELSHPSHNAMVSAEYGKYQNNESILTDSTH